MHLEYKGTCLNKRSLYFNKVFLPYVFMYFFWCLVPMTGLHIRFVADHEDQISLHKYHILQDKHNITPLTILLFLTIVTSDHEKVLSSKLQDRITFI